MTKHRTPYTRAIRCAILHFPVATTSPEHDFCYYHDGLLIIEDERITHLGDAADLLAQWQTEHPDLSVEHHPGKLLIPGLIDSHVHFPQTEMIASYGEQLLEWLENYTFPTERKFADPDYAKHIAEAFLQQLWRNGTTTALAYSTVHTCAAEALFRAADKRNMLLITGKTCMDRHCPDYLQDSPESAFEESQALIAKWHNKGRLKYAITPRFAPTSTPAQLQALGDLVAQHDDVFVQTHLSENQAEIAWVQSLYPDAKDYLNVYEHYGLVTNRTVFGHGIHLNEDCWQRLAEHQAIIAFCPRSNTFLGSGLFDLKTAERFGVAVALASDVGGGDSFNMLRTQGEAYKVCQLQGFALHPLRGLYMMTQGAACALGLANSAGNLNPGSHADFVLLDPEFNELTALRMQSRQQANRTHRTNLTNRTQQTDPSQHSHHLAEDIIFALSMLGDERAIVETSISGQPVYQRSAVDTE